MAAFEWKRGWYVFSSKLARLFVQVWTQQYSICKQHKPKRASKSKLRTHDKGCLDQHFLDNFSFHKLCLFMCRM